MARSYALLSYVTLICIFVIGVYISDRFTSIYHSDTTSHSFYRPGDMEKNVLDQMQIPVELHFVVSDNPVHILGSRREALMIWLEQVRLLRPQVFKWRGGRSQHDGPENHPSKLLPHDREVFDGVNSDFEGFILRNQLGNSRVIPVRKAESIIQIKQALMMALEQLGRLQKPQLQLFIGASLSEYQDRLMAKLSPFVEPIILRDINQDFTPNIPLMMVQAGSLPENISQRIHHAVVEGLPLMILVDPSLPGEVGLPPWVENEGIKLRQDIYPASSTSFSAWIRHQDYTSEVMKSHDELSIHPFIIEGARLLPPWQGAGLFEYPPTATGIEPVVKVSGSAMLVSKKPPYTVTALDPQRQALVLRLKGHTKNILMMANIDQLLQPNQNNLYDMNIQVAFLLQLLSMSDVAFSWSDDGMDRSFATQDKTHSPSLWNDRWSVVATRLLQEHDRLLHLYSKTVKTEQDNQLIKQTQQAFELALQEAERIWPSTDRSHDRQNIGMVVLQIMVAPSLFILVGAIAISYRRLRRRDVL
ncbi:MAG: hypothetical protein EBT20_02675 [Alphaproteobacteria bacterium]|nr:hypothetical protein [Alphaproteobacteria bacterium]